MICCNCVFWEEKGNRPGKGDCKSKDVLKLTSAIGLETDGAFGCIWGTDVHVADFNNILTKSLLGIWERLDE